jgi:parallel beta-helix repeat protein
MWKTSSFFALVLVAMSLGSAAAANCGGAVPCRCGDTVTESYAMTADLGECPGHGLLVKSHVTLDCRGHRITGTGAGGERYGVYVRGDSGAEIRSATVRNCQITGFQHGIRLRAAEDSQILDNRLYANGDFAGHSGYGIDVTVGSMNNVIQGNAIEGNADEGIHLASGTGQNLLADNVFRDNYREQIYVLSSHGNRLVGNRTSGSGSNSLYLKDSRDNRLEGNTFEDRVARVTGDASGNIFADNVFDRAQLQFHVYDASPDRVPTGNTVIGGSMTNPGGTCLRFVSARDNVIADVDLLDCGTEAASEGTATQPSSNALVGMALSPGRTAVDGDSSLATGWWLSARVRDGAGKPVAGARVVITDALGDTLVDLLTGADGTVPPQALAEKVRVGAGVIERTPHVLATTHSGHAPDVRLVDLRQDTVVTVALSGGTGGGGSGDGGGGGDGGGSGDGDGGGGDGGGPGSFFDDFAREDSDSPGNGWAEAVGDLAIEAGALRSGWLKGYNVAALPAPVGADQTVAADFVSTANDTRPRFGLVLRYQDPRNYYAAYRQVAGTSSLRLVRVEDGVETVLASINHPKPRVHSVFRLEASASGAALELALDGVTMLSVTDTTFAAGGVGVVLGSLSKKTCRADNFAASVR